MKEKKEEKVKKNEKKKKKEELYEYLTLNKSIEAFENTSTRKFHSSFMSSEVEFHCNDK